MVIPPYVAADWPFCTTLAILAILAILAQRGFYVKLLFKMDFFAI